MSPPFLSLFTFYRAQQSPQEDHFKP